jgi:Flp pilus assembly protein TadG
MFKRIAQEEAGQVLVMTLLTMTCLMGFLALAVDIGMLFRARRSAQTAADAAAIAGALEWEYNGSTNVTSVARTAAGNNGVTSTATNVDVHTSPNITSPYHTAAGYVEVIVHQPNPTIFMSAFGALSGNAGWSSVNVSARSIAGITPSTACIIALDKNSDDDAFWIKGNTTIQTPNCGIQVNSSSTGAFCDQGNAKIDGPYIRVTGNQKNGGKCGKPSGAPLLSGVPPANDPYAGLPDPSSQCNSGNTVPASTTNITSDPGIASLVTVPTTAAAYGGTSYNLTCFAGAVTLSNVTLGSNADQGNVYVFLNGVSMSGADTVYGAIDVANGTYAQGNATLNSYATGSDNNSSDKQFTFNSISIYQPSTNTTATCQDSSAKNAALTSSPFSNKNPEPCLQAQFGSGSGNLEGVIYAPTSMVYLQDQGGGVQAAGVVSYTVYVNSQLTITNNYSRANPSSTPLSTVSMVE